MARFPFQKNLESFDWKFQPSIDPAAVIEFANRIRDALDTGHAP